jgi:Putative beta-lactamase-inhibitor-like, PepSY-like
MKSVFNTLVVAVVLWAALAGSDQLFAQEKKIAVKDLPAAVAASFKAAYPKAEIKGTATEVEGGVTYYEIESVDGKTKRDLLFAKNGKIFETEEIVAGDALPAAVKDAIAKAVPKGKISSAEKTVRESKTQFDVTVKKGTKTFAVAIDEKGTVLKNKEVKKEKKEEKEEKGEKD